MTDQQFDRNTWQCPKCGAPLEDWYMVGVNDFIDKWSEDRFRCNGHLIQPLPHPQASYQSAINRTKSCGYFGLEDLGVEYSE
ncbi:hypothetical protein DPW02_11465 [Aggregatibacter aphrophilus]|nr:hypothetical protein DPW02_11465 [Aggregatibacter aphrophilus]